MRTPTILIATLLLAACDRPAIDPSQSLVGAKTLPSASELNQELIGIYYNQNRPLTRQLSFELKPSDDWAIVISDVESGRELSRRTTSLPKNQAAAARKALWRLRPEKLAGVQWLQLPADCPQQPTDSFGPVSIGFIREGPKPGVEDDQIGVFSLPILEYCNTPQGRAAHRLVQDLMQKMPGQELRRQHSYHPPSG